MLYYNNIKHNRIEQSILAYIQIYFNEIYEDILQHN